MKKYLLFPSLFISILILPLTVQAAKDLKANIVDGVEVKAESPIAQQSVFVSGTYTRMSYNCSATILSKNIIMTAAHCLGPYYRGILTVTFKKPGTTPVTARVISQKAYYDQPPTTLAEGHDIALLKIDRDIPAGYSAVTLPTSAMVKNGDILTMAGYGKTNRNPNDTSVGLGTLRSADSNVIEANYGNVGELLINIKKGGACQGDSGGPAYLKYNNELIQVGVASRLTPKNEVPSQNPRAGKAYACIEEIVYTGVFPHLQWIEDTAKAL